MVSIWVLGQILVLFLNQPGVLGFIGADARATFYLSKIRGVDRLGPSRWRPSDPFVAKLFCNFFLLIYSDLRFIRHDKASMRFLKEFVRRHHRHWVIFTNDILILLER